MAFRDQFGRRFLPELDLFETRAEQRRARDKAYEAVTRMRSHWLCVFCLLMIIASLTIVGPFWLAPLVSRHFSIPAPVVLAIPGPAIAFSFGLFTLYAYRHAMRRSLREMLIDRGVPICVHCGYDLHAAPEPRCPECGREFDAALLRNRDSDLDGSSLDTARTINNLD